jgi:N12 class adenine-specific DNA methylase
MGQKEQMEDEDEVPLQEEQEQEEEPNEHEQQNEEDIVRPEQEEQMEMETEDKEYSEKCQRRLQSNLHKYDMVRTKKWMRRIDQAEIGIGQIIAELEIKNVANLMRMSMADTDIGIFEET